MHKKITWAGVVVVVGALTGLAWGREVTIDKTDSTGGWMIYKDKAAAGTVEVAPGPNADMKALEMKYDLAGGNWAAWVKKIPAGMQDMEALVFYFKGEGNYNFEVKVADDSGATFGSKFPGGANIPQWQKIVLPIKLLNYLWGGNTNTLEPRNIRKLEFAVSTDKTGGPGRILVSELQYISQSGGPVQPQLPFKISTPSAAPKTGTYNPLGQFEILTIPEWQTFADRGAVIRLSVGEGQTSGKKALQTEFSWGFQEVKGSQEQTGNWVAFLKDIKMDLSEMRSLIITYKGNGSAANLEVKLKDQFDATYAKVYVSATSMPGWTTLTIPRSELTYLRGGDGSGKFDWGHVKTLELALSRPTGATGNGQLIISNIAFESAAAGGRKNLAPGGSGTEASSNQMKVVIDDFTNLNPATLYFVVPGDDSTMNLSSSRITFESGYSLRLEYSLQSVRPTGSWVEAQRRFTPTLDWTGVETVKIWVKGDGSQNIFRFTLTDGDGNRWVADNQAVLTSTDWQLVEMPVDAFTLYDELYLEQKSGRNLKAKLHTIRQISFGIVSQPTRNSRNNGEVFLETLYILGQAVNPVSSAPLAEKPPVGIALPLKNWNMGGNSVTTLESQPALGMNFTQQLTTRLNGNYEKFSVTGEILMNSTFGDSTDGYRSQDAVVSSPNVNLMILNPVDGISSLTLGNLYFSSFSDIFANDNLYGAWGFKGALLEGWIDKLHHRTYFIKHAPDSYTVAGDYALSWGGFNAEFVGTYVNQQPFIVNATQLLSEDKAFLLELSQNLNVGNLFTVIATATGGVDWYQKYWDPSTLLPLDEGHQGTYFTGELNFSELANIFWPGFSLRGRYRYVGPDFKPTFRQSPGSWDVESGDQKGYNAKFLQNIGGGFLSAEYNKFSRVSNTDQGNSRTIFTVGYNDWASLDLSVSYEVAERLYHYLDTRYLFAGQPAQIDENRHEDIATVYLAYHFNGSLIISQWFQFKKYLQHETNETYSEMYAVAKLSYYIASNLIFSLENKFTRYGRPQDIPVIDPNDPYSLYQYTRAKIEVTF